MAVASQVLVVGGSPEAPHAGLLRELARRSDAVIAVDHGLDALLDAGLSCDLFCGDADSVGARGALLVEAAQADAFVASHRACVGAVERYNPAKDATDLSLALSAAAARWPQARVVCTGLSGGRPDHALAALGQLTAIPAGAALEENGFSARVLHAGCTWDIEERVGATFSFVPVAADTVVSESGMRWELDHHRAQLLDDLGISNVISAPQAAITCHTGALIAWLFK